MFYKLIIMKITRLIKICTVIIMKYLLQSNYYQNIDLSSIIVMIITLQYKANLVLFLYFSLRFVY